MKSYIFITLFLVEILTYPQAKVVRGHQNTDRNDTGSYNAALIAAAKDGHEHLVEMLIEKSLSSNISLANVNAANQFGDTPLHAAANAGKVKIVQLLIRSGASIGIRNNNGKSPRDLATEKGYKEIAKLLSVSHRACNLYTNSPTFRIIGGEPANLIWMAALGYLSSNFSISFDCGATIISDLFVLTAAHCARDDRRPVTVRIGQLSITNNGGIEPEKHYIEKIIRHPDYSPTKKKNDIALIQLVKRIYFSNTVGPACLHTDLEDIDPNVMLTVSGWGRISNQVRHRSDILLKANIKTMSLSQCNTTVWEYNKGKDMAAYRDGISDSQYCAHDPNGVRDSCDGDSGGPLQIIQDDNLPAKVVGIVSFSITCGTTFPSIYTRVASYVDWIEPYVWPNDVISPPLINLAVQDTFSGGLDVPEMLRVSQKACEVYSNLQFEHLSQITDRIFPWTASLGYLGSDSETTFDCSGTIISDSFILTAAHCARWHDKPIIVQLNDASSGNEAFQAGAPPQKHWIKSVIRHSDFSIVKKINDIILIELTNRITFTPFVRPACLQTDLRDEDPNTKLILTAWRIKAPRSNVLRIKEFQTVPLSDCNTTLVEHNQRYNLELRHGLGEGQYCAHQLFNNETNECYGDGGGPLQIYYNNLAPATVVGIVSFGVGCGSVLPDVHTRVAYYLDWIESIVWPNGEIPIPLINTAI